MLAFLSHQCVYSSSSVICETIYPTGHQPPERAYVPRAVVCINGLKFFSHGTQQHYENHASIFGHLMPGQYRFLWATCARNPLNGQNASLNTAPKCNNWNLICWTPTMLFSAKIKWILSDYLPGMPERRARVWACTVWFVHKTVYKRTNLMEKYFTMYIFIYNGHVSLCPAWLKCPFPEHNLISYCPCL